MRNTSIDDELVFNNADLSLNQNKLSHHSQQIISKELPEGYIESPMWVGTGTQLQARKLPADSDQQAIFASKFESVREKIATWQKTIGEDPITLEGIKNYKRHYMLE